MKDLRQLTLIIFLLTLFNYSAYAQEEEENKEEEELKNRVVFSLGYTWIPKGAELSESEAESGFFVPAVGFDYFRKIHEKFEIGMMWDWELDHYIVTGKELERERAMIFALVLTYSITEKWKAFTGGGAEFEKHENLGIFRLGTEYAFEMQRNWEFTPTLLFDIKKGYDTWGISLGFCKKF
ncbi:hypothetical protein [Echinicola shivajiensis]|uniref:hypothetical protein n=1 Tax=Echinicola shivajiensis TaxID=1035916 RepID=UPI001FE6A57F|nr:hypothetical protein [Echinicola shivajiensis]